MRETTGVIEMPRGGRKMEAREEGKKGMQRKGKTCGNRSSRHIKEWVREFH